MWTLGTLIEARRKFLEMSQEEVAQLVPCKRAYISLIETSTDKKHPQPSNKILDGLARALKLDRREVYRAAEYPIEAVTEQAEPTLNHLARQYYQIREPKDRAFIDILIRALADMLDLMSGDGEARGADNEIDSIRVEVARRIPRREAN